MNDGPVIVDRLDHLVLTVADIDKTCDFYGRVLGMEKVVFAGGRTALAFGRQKINLHPAGNEYEPKAKTALPGTGDLCFIAETPITAIIQRLQDCGVDIIEGPVSKTGATGPLSKRRPKEERA